MKKLLLLPLLLTICHCVTHAQSPGPMLLEYPTVSRTKIAFAYAGDIWLVDRNGVRRNGSPTLPLVNSIQCFRRMVPKSPLRVSILLSVRSVGMFM